MLGQNRSSLHFSTKIMLINNQLINDFHFFAKLKPSLTKKLYIIGRKLNFQKKI